MKRMPIARKTSLKAKAPMRKRAPNLARRKATRHHMNKVAALGCIACRIDGNADTPCELHHPRTNAGAGQKSSDADVIPLCPAHHRGTHHPAIPSIHLDRLKFINRFGDEARLLELTKELIWR